MKFGKIRIEDGHLIFQRHMMPNRLPCGDILWAYIQNEIPAENTAEEQDNNSEAHFGESRFVSYRLVITTKRHKQYQFEMSEAEAQSCILLLKAMNPSLAVGLPKGGRIPSQNLNNTRDLGGLITMDDKTIAPGRLLRSGDLYHLSLEDQRTLVEDYNLKKVIDFRSYDEAKARPDTVMAGVEYYHLPILDEVIGGMSMDGNLSRTMLSRNDITGETMEDLYESMVSDRYCMKQLAGFMDILLKPVQGAVLWHGAYGKDRTGVATALVLMALGVSRKTIRADYLRSNDFLENERKYLVRYLESCNPRDSFLRKEKLPLLYTVHENWLNRVFHRITITYGSAQEFFRQELYVSPKSIEEMKANYLL